MFPGERAARIQETKDLISFYEGAFNGPMFVEGQQIT